MDLNMSTTFVNSKQENNQLLLNAIKNKFDGQTCQEAPNFSPPKFNIPLLKIPSSCITTNVDKDSNTPAKQPSDSAATELNKFLLKQLQEKHASNNLCKESSGFVLPQLQSRADKTAKSFVLPILKPQTQQSKHISSLTTAINKLELQENSCEDKLKLSAPASIDLTIALASKTSCSKNFVKPTLSNDNLDFDIPFIDCDLPDVSKNLQILSPDCNDYCITDVSQLFLQHSLTEPSAIGRFICIDDNKYTAPLPLTFLSPDYRQQKGKHNIEPFLFETKSPDDLVLIALNKYQRR